jgi:hypothetical protein
MRDRSTAGGPASGTDRHRRLCAQVFGPDDDAQIWCDKYGAARWDDEGAAAVNVGLFYLETQFPVETRVSHISLLRNPCRNPGCFRSNKVDNLSAL